MRLSGRLASSTAAAETVSPTPKSAATDVGPTSTSMSVNEAPSTSKVGAKGSPETVDTPSAVLTPPSPPPVWTLSDAEPRRAPPIVRAASPLAGTASAKATVATKSTSQRYCPTTDARVRPSES